MSETSLERQPIAAADSHRKGERATAAAVCSLVEYYDFSVYGYVAATLAVVFFPEQDPIVGC